MQKTEIFKYIEHMAALIRSEQRKKCAELRLQIVHFEVLNYLSEANRYTDTPAATAAFFGMTRGTVSQSLIVLEKKGYIEKSNDENDKRIIHVHVLPQGLSILQKARPRKLFATASSLLAKKISNSTLLRTAFIEAFNALQKASQIESIKKGNNRKFNILNKPDAFELVERMAAVIRFEERKRCTQLKLQMVHLQVLEYLSVCNKYSDTPAAIANYLGITRGTVSQTLTILQNRELITKSQDNTDKRVVHIQLLPKGQEILKQAKPTKLFNKATSILMENAAVNINERVFIEALNALQKANDSYSFGVCQTCINFTSKANAFYCKLTREPLSDGDSVKICQEHVPV